MQGDIHRQDGRNVDSRIHCVFPVHTSTSPYVLQLSARGGLLACESLQWLLYDRRAKELGINSGNLLSLLRDFWPFQQLPRLLLLPLPEPARTECQRIPPFRPAEKGQGMPAAGPRGVLQSYRREHYIERFPGEEVPTYCLFEDHEGENVAVGAGY